jgi:hypothetical protein
MIEKIRLVMTNTGISSKQRSAWIESCIVSFLELENKDELVTEEFMSPGKNISVPITLSTSTINAIDVCIEEVEKLQGEITDRSAVIRTAITQRLSLF